MPLPIPGNLKFFNIAGAKLEFFKIQFYKKILNAPFFNLSKKFFPVNNPLPYFNFFFFSRPVRKMRGYEPTGVFIKVGGRLIAKIYYLSLKLHLNQSGIKTTHQGIINKLTFLH